MAKGGYRSRWGPMGMGCDPKPWGGKAVKFVRDEFDDVAKLEQLWMWSSALQGLVLPGEIQELPQVS